MTLNSCSGCGEPNKHPARHIRHGGKSACVDEELADLVLLLWRLGVNTSESCQYEPDEYMAIWLSPVDLERWVDLMLAGGDDEIYYKVFNADDSRQGWRMTVSASFCEEDTTVIVAPAASDDEPPMYKGCRINVGLGVYFPRADLLEVMNRLRVTARNAAAL